MMLKRLKKVPNSKLLQTVKTVSHINNILKLRKEK